MIYVHYLQSKRYLWMALHGAQGDHPTEGREAPEAEAVQPSQLAVVAKPTESSFGGSWWESRNRWNMESPAGSSGGSAEGASEGRQPLTGPHLPPAAQAAKTQLKKKPPRRRPEQNKMKKPPCPQAQKITLTKLLAFLQSMQKLNHADTAQLFA